MSFADYYFTDYLAIAIILCVFLFILISRWKYKKEEAVQVQKKQEGNSENEFEGNRLIDIDVESEIQLVQVFLEEEAKCKWKSKLELWYFKEAGKYKKQVEALFTSLSIYVLMKLVASFAVLIIIIINFRETDGDSVVIFLFDFLLITACFIWYLGTKKAARKNKTNLQETFSPGIWQQCYNLQNRMDLHLLKLEVWLIKKSNALPSAVKNNHTIHLYFSAGSLSEFYSKPKELESIIGHEFGHAFQNDDDITLAIQKSAMVPALLGTLSILASFLYWLSDLSANSFFSILPNIGLIVFVLPFWKLFFMRIQSEHLADMASVIFVADSKMKDILRIYASEYGSLNYPSRQKRLDYIDKIIQENS